MDLLDQILHLEPILPEALNLMKLNILLQVQILNNHSHFLWIKKKNKTKVWSVQLEKALDFGISFGLHSTWDWDKCGS